VKFGAGVCRGSLIGGWILTIGGGGFAALAHMVVRVVSLKVAAY